MYKNGLIRKMSVNRIQHDKRFSLKEVEYFLHYGVIKQDIKSALLGMTQFLATESPLKMMKMHFVLL